MIELIKIQNIFIVRCKVPECDIGENNRNIPFMQPWVSHGIPMKNEKLDNCVHYALKNSTIGQCSADTAFDTSKEIPCTEFIHATDERNIQTEVKNSEPKIMSFAHEFIWFWFFSSTFIVQTLGNWQLLDRLGT